MLMVFAYELTLDGGFRTPPIHVKEKIGYLRCCHQGYVEDTQPYLFNRSFEQRHVALDCEHKYPYEDRECFSSPLFNDHLADPVNEVRLRYRFLRGRKWHDLAFPYPGPSNGV